MTMNASDRHALPAPLAGLTRPEAYAHPVGAVRVEETHISWVLLTGDWAYKLKKPVDLGFLDFSTLAARKHYCEEEVRLNRRLAPDLYDSVVAITGTAGQPRVGGEGPALEYAVKMRQFPQEALAGRLLEAGQIGAEAIDRLADEVAAFHQGAQAAGALDPHGTPAAVAAPVRENFRQIRDKVAAAAGESVLDEVERWSIAAVERLAPRFSQRRAEGRVRECHGDLHLGNIVRIGGRLVPFDCIEFSPELRYIDVMSEAAFLAMDLAHRKRPDLAHRFLNRYLEATGDYGGLDVLPFYEVYRALVRAKIHAIRAGQMGEGHDHAGKTLAGFRDYVELAARCTRPRRAALVITHGLSGSGKTTAALAVLETIGAVRVRADVERKRLHGLPPLAVTRSGVGTGIYSKAANSATYARLRDLARAIVKAGFPVIVDAAFLRRAERDALRVLAGELAAPFLILDCAAPEAVLRERVAARAAAGNDASEADVAVLEHQLASAEPLAADERAAAIAVGEDFASVARAVACRLAPPAQPPAR